VLEPGVYRTRPSVSFVLKRDVRPRQLTVPGQEMLTSDGVAVRVSLSAIVRVVDPYKALTGFGGEEDPVYLALQLALRQLVPALSADELPGARVEIGEKALQLASGMADEAGFEIVSVAVKDLLFDNEYRRALAEKTLVRIQGQAQLEKVRAETAAMRNLNNAAKLIETNPGLAKLRLFELMEKSVDLSFAIGIDREGAITGAPLSR